MLLNKWLHRLRKKGILMIKKLAVLVFVAFFGFAQAAPVSAQTAPASTSQSGAKKSSAQNKSTKKKSSKKSTKKTKSTKSSKAGKTTKAG